MEISTKKKQLSNDAFENVTFSTAICIFRVHVSFLGPMILTSSILRGNDSMTVSAFKVARFPGFNQVRLSDVEPRVVGCEVVLLLGIMNHSFCIV